MPELSLAKQLLLPELKLIRIDSGHLWVCEKVSDREVCPRCAAYSKSIYDHRWVKVRDAPIRGAVPCLMILKRRFWCAQCQKPFTEPVPGILPGRRTTQRFRAAVFEAAEKFQNLSQVRADFEISSDFVYRALYEQLELRRRMNNIYPWPARIGIDEHGMGKNRETGRRQFVSMVVNHSRGKLMEVVLGKTSHELEQALGEIPGRENVKEVSMDMCDPYRNFVRRFFPQARIVADKFHVLRLLSAALLRERKKITGTRADAKTRGLLLVKSSRLKQYERLALQYYLKEHPVLKELYDFKEMLHEFYEISHPRRASLDLDALILVSQLSQQVEILRLGKTLQKWKVEILNYFEKRLTNARLEGFNNKASLVRRRGYGYKSFRNYRLRLLSACS